MTITVFFDGACPVCSREIALYRRLERQGRIAWHDLAGPGDRLRGQPFGLAAALELLHVEDARGRLHIGLDAHLLMWQQLPVLKFLSWALRRWPAARPPLEALYLAFTKRRPGLLQRRRRVGASHG